jgi:hypothetical protein
LAGRPDRDHLGAGAQVGHRHELLVRVEGELLQHRREQQHRGGREQHGIPIARRGSDQTGADGAAGARPILDDEALPELVCEMLGAESRHHVGVAAGGQRHDHGHRPRRPFRRTAWSCDHQESNDGDKSE